MPCCPKVSLLGVRRSRKHASQGKGSKTVSGGGRRGPCSIGCGLEFLQGSRSPRSLASGSTGPGRVGPAPGAAPAVGAGQALGGHGTPAAAPLLIPPRSSGPRGVRGVRPRGTAARRQGRHPRPLGVTSASVQLSSAETPVSEGRVGDGGLQVCKVTGLRL